LAAILRTCRPPPHQLKGLLTHWRRGRASYYEMGYVRVYVRPGVRDLQHRVIWRAAHGSIPRDMHLDHINGDKTDNRLENLRLVENLEHQAIHVAARAGRWSIKHAACVLCRKTDHPHHTRGLCKPCYNLARRVRKLF
jgi:hypothetical protein